MDACAEADADLDDPQGKKRIHRSFWGRYAKSLATWVSCACVGFLLAQFLYIYANTTLGDWAFEAADGTKIRQLHRFDIDIRQDPDALPEWNGRPRNELERVLRIVAPAAAGAPKEVLIALCTEGLLKQGLLEMFLDTLLQSGVKNYLIVGIDKKVRDFLAAKGLNVYYYEVEDVAAIEGSNWWVSAKKFGVIEEFLKLGYNVLLSDIDVVILKNPFDHLYRDHDIEAMSDGFNEATAYGQHEDFDDPTMGWSRHAQGIAHMNLNTGFFYIRSNRRTLALMAGMVERLKGHPDLWDQAELNMLLFQLSHKEHLNPRCSVRVMDIEQFMNSKVLFKSYRQRPATLILGDRRPVALHMNYHPDKYQRMKAAIQFFLQGDGIPMSRLPGGSEPGS